MLEHAGALNALKHNIDDPDSDVTIEYLAKYSWTVGSEATVTEKLEELYDKSGGFGVLAVNSYDHIDSMTQWRQSIEALCHRIVPALDEKFGTVASPAGAPDMVQAA